MGIYIPGIEMPISCTKCPCSDDEVRYCLAANEWIPMLGKPEFCPLVEVPAHGRLVDADKLHDAMYHRAFETDGDTMWQSGCWVRYRAIEQTMDAAPTVIPEGEA